MEKIVKIFKQHKEIILYLIFGILTTLVNIVIFYLFNDIIQIDYKISNIVAWILSVIVAFITNKTIVFKSKNKNKKELCKEIIEFFIARVISLVIDMIMMILIIDVIKINPLIAKIVTNVVVIIINYIFSKFIIFKKEG